MLEGALLKISRAYTQTNDFGRDVERFFSDRDDPAYSVAVQRDTDPRKRVAVFRILKKPPETWPVHIGEIIHNLRSALDHLIYEVSAPDEHGQPLTGTEFPIFMDEAEFRTKRAQRKIRGLNAATLAVIERFQPFKTKDPADIPFLWILHQVSNTDKHRLLNIVTTVHTLREIKILYQPGVTPLTTAHIAQGMRVNRKARLEDGAEYFSFWTLEPLPDDTQVNMDTEMAVHVEFGDATPSANRLPVSDTLHGIGRLVSAFRNEFIKLNSGPV